MHRENGCQTKRGGVALRTPRIIFAVVLVLGLASVAQANSLTDPAIIIGGKNSAIIFTPGHTSITLTFGQVNQPNGGSCMLGTTKLNNVFLPSMLCGIVNLTGAPLKGFNFAFSSPQMLTLLVSTKTPGLGTWTKNPNGTFATFLFAHPLPSPGDVAINFVNFATSTPIGVSRVPEPATLTLLASGLGALLVRRRTRRALG